MLCAALHECVAAGALPPARRPGADELCWIAVHGLAALAVDGVLPSGGDHFDALLEATLDLVAGGLGATP
jgi:hypothetical protein